MRDFCETLMNQKAAIAPIDACAATELTAPHAMSAREVILALGTDATAGFQEATAAERLARYGANELAQAPPEPWWRRLARQFADLLIWILIAAAIISGVLGEWIDAVAILAIVVLNGILGFVQEGRAEQALAALRKLSSPHAKAVRDGRLAEPARRRARARRPHRPGGRATACRPTCG